MTMFRGNSQNRSKVRIVKDAIALMIEGDVLVRLKPEALIEPVLGKPLIGGVRMVVAEVGRLNETQLRLKAGADVDDSCRVKLKAWPERCSCSVLAGPAE